MTTRRTFSRGSWGLVALAMTGACGSPPTPVTARCPPVAPAPDPPPIPAAVAVAPPFDATVAAGDFAVTVRSTPFGNLAYQLDCLADLIHCSSAAIHSFWAPTWTPDDDAALAVWKGVRKTYDVSAPLQTAATHALVPLPHNELEFDKTLRIAAQVASSIDDFRRSLAILLPPQDAARLASAAEHFLPRFEAWWTSTGQGVARPFRDGLVDLLKGPELGAVITRAARFYATPLPKGTPIDFDLVILPAKAEWTSGEQMSAHGIIEVLPGEKPEGRMDVVCHELFHFFYNARSVQQQEALAARYTSSADPLAAIAYFLVDESVATAIGNGVVNRTVNPPDYAKRYKRELGFYGNHAIDATAKGILARTAEDPTLGPPLDSAETTATLLAATRDAVGPDPRPIEYLHTYAAASDDGWWDDVMKVTGEAANSNNVHHASPVDAAHAVETVRDQPAVSVVLVVPRARIGLLAASGAAVPRPAQRAIAAEARKKAPFAYVWRRSPQARVFAIVADDPAGAKLVADALFAEPRAVLGTYRPGAAPPPIR